jgi:hypothetical protein
MFRSISDTDTLPCRLRELQEKLSCDCEHALELMIINGILIFQNVIFDLLDEGLPPKP